MFYSYSYNSATFIFKHLYRHTACPCHKKTRKCVSHKCQATPHVILISRKCVSFFILEICLYWCSRVKFFGPNFTHRLHASAFSPRKKPTPRNQHGKWNNRKFNRLKRVHAFWVFSVFWLSKLFGHFLGHFPQHPPKFWTFFVYFTKTQKGPLYSEGRSKRPLEGQFNPWPPPEVIPNLKFTQMRELMKCVKSRFHGIRQFGLPKIVALLSSSK